ncbi:CrpP family ICE-associated protein [Pseudomonas aeruginosa]|uniref:CrpP family ICE-associated protein n=1 Tax=Pseudomonas aeruginosa TaxID=287 RepID=UPI003F76D8CC
MNRKDDQAGSHCPEPLTRTVRALGAEAARKGLRVFDCPYSHPAMRASWLKGFAQEQQQQLDF